MTHLRPALVLLVLLSLLTGLAYPFAMTGLAKTLFPKQAAGSLIERDGQVIGSALIGQNFTSDPYFHGRPSATSTADPADATKTIAAPYNAGNSSGSNAGPTAKSLIDRVQGDVDLLKKENPGVPIPADLVTTSASGLDPHITPAGADFQVPAHRQDPGCSRRQATRTRRRTHRAALPRRAWRAGGQRAGAESGARQGGAVHRTGEAGRSSEAVIQTCA